jgi:hypothetical protein
MLYRTLIAFTAAVALGCVPISSSAFAGGHGGGGRAGGAHAMGGHAMGGHAMAGHGRGGGRQYAGGRRGGYGYGGGYGCNGYYNNYNGCGYDPAAAIVGGVIGGALNGFGNF